VGKNNFVSQQVKQRSPFIPPQTCLNFTAGQAFGTQAGRASKLRVKIDRP